jgi:hypothetical protein
MVSQSVHVSPDLAMHAVSAVYPALLASMKEADTRVQDDIRSHKPTESDPSDGNAQGSAKTAGGGCSGPGHARSRGAGGGENYPLLSEIFSFKLDRA